MGHLPIRGGGGVGQQAVATCLPRLYDGRIHIPLSLVQVRAGGTEDCS